MLTVRELIKVLQEVPEEKQDTVIGVWDHCDEGVFFFHNFSVTLENKDPRTQSYCKGDHPCGDWNCCDEMVVIRNEYMEKYHGNRFWNKEN